MSVKAYVLMNLSSTNIAEALNQVKAVKGVKLADAVTGPYDAIIQVEAADMDELGRLVTTKILKVKGIAKTLTCVAV
ncbi:MAG: Lrp/AsnC ligand binding domain-containing protein [Candidatus Omnitrophica bacterium]|nr:Lrp/AsnC ligand binding domain-containing protein [Candidatus Omnitrophota bacterium]